MLEHARLEAVCHGVLRDSGQERGLGQGEPSRGGLGVRRRFGRGPASRRVEGPAPVPERPPLEFVVLSTSVTVSVLVSSTSRQGALSLGCAGP